MASLGRTAGLSLLPILAVLVACQREPLPPSETLASPARRLSTLAEATQTDVEGFLAPGKTALRESERPMFRIELATMAGDALRTSKIGGAAWWPDGTPAPRDEQGAPMALLAQINFAELPSPLPGYPSRGLLQFFICGNDDFYGANLNDQLNMSTLAVQRNFRVVYWPDTSGRAAPIAPLSGEDLPFEPNAPRRMRFVPGRETLSVGDYRFERLFGGNTSMALQHYAAAHHLDEDSLADLVWEARSGFGHKLGGYPGFTQTDPRDRGDYELLLQLDSDDAMMWGDSGVANFFITPKDLQRRDFSRVAYNWDCM